MKQQVSKNYQYIYRFAKEGEKWAEVLNGMRAAENPKLNKRSPPHVKGATNHPILLMCPAHLHKAWGNDGMGYLTRDGRGPQSGISTKANPYLSRQIKERILRPTLGNAGTPLHHAKPHASCSHIHQQPLQGESPREKCT